MWEVFSDGDEPYEGLTHMEVRQRKCWDQNPDERYDMKQVVRFFEDHFESKIKRKKQQMWSAEKTELTVKDDKDIIEEYLKENGKMMMQQLLQQIRMLKN
ncbi:hypothetical protein DINM_000783 [Dirofilaria immitis]|nr:hypothetical protein [Dirofilaria immitis]